MEVSAHLNSVRISAQKARLVADLGSEWTMILRNHGLLTCGISAVDAFYRLYFLERACDVQVAALAGNAPLQFPSEEVQTLTKKQGAGGKQERME